MNRRNPFDALGLPTDPDLTDDQVHAAWRTIAAETHPDRPDGGDLPRYTAASAAYAELSTRWGRTEAWADIIEELQAPHQHPSRRHTLTRPVCRLDGCRYSNHN